MLSLLLASRAIHQGNNMLKNLTYPIPTIIREMEKSEFDFFLTGSRFWGNPLPGSDWDFFVNDSSAVRQWLTENHFSICQGDGHYPEDKYTNAVFSFEGGEFHDSPVQVQVVKSAQIKNKIQEHLFKLYPEGIVGKGNATKIWESAYTLHKLGYDLGIETGYRQGYGAAKVEST